MRNRIACILLLTTFVVVSCNKVESELTPAQEEVVLDLIMKESGRTLPSNVAASCQQVTAGFMKQYPKESFQCAGMKIVTEDGIKLLEVKLLFNGKTLTYKL